MNAFQNPSDGYVYPQMGSLKKDLIPPAPTSAIEQAVLQRPQMIDAENHLTNEHIEL